jgi:hypothetical protein
MYNTLRVATGDVGVLNVVIDAPPMNLSHARASSLPAPRARPPSLAIDTTGSWFELVPQHP